MINIKVCIYVRYQLKYNKIRIENKTFKQFKKLLKSGKIQFITYKVNIQLKTQVFRNITHLDVSENRLVHISCENFVHCKRLRVLNLSKNKIEKFGFKTCVSSCSLIIDNFKIFQLKFKTIAIL